MTWYMTPFQAIVAVAAPNVGHGAALTGVGVVTLLVVAVVVAAIWGAVRLRSVQPVLRKGGYEIREQRFAAGVLEDFYANALTSEPVRAAWPATETPTSRASGPELSGVFGESIRELAEAIRSLATAVEQAALVGGGSELDRAARSMEAFTSGLGALPIKDVMVSAGTAAETRANRQERL